MSCSSPSISQSDRTRQVNVKRKFRPGGPLSVVRKVNPQSVTAQFGVRQRSEDLYTAGCTQGRVSFIIYVNIYSLRRHRNTVEIAGRGKNIESGANTARYKSISGTAYLETSAIRRHEWHVLIIFFFRGRRAPGVCAEGTVARAITFSCHFANGFGPDEFCGFRGNCPRARRARHIRGSKTKSPGNINTGRQPLLKRRRHRRARVDADYLADAT